MNVVSSKRKEILHEVRKLSEYGCEDGSKKKLFHSCSYDSVNCGK